MLPTSRGHIVILAAMLLFASVAFSAQTLLNFSTQVTGIGAVSNGMTAAATTSDSFVLSGPASGASAAYSFKAYPFSQFSSFPIVSQDTESDCSASGSSMTCIGEAPNSSGSDTVATSTLPTFTSATSDTTGAGCGTFLSSNIETWYAGRKASLLAYAKIDSTSGVRDYMGLVNGGNLFCASETSIANATATIRFSSTTPDTHFMGQVTDGVGTNVVTCDTLVNGDTNFHWFKVYFDNDNSRVAFYVDNLVTPGCTISSNFDATLSYHWLFMAYCNTCGGTAKNVDIARFSMKTTPF